MMHQPLPRLLHPILGIGSRLAGWLPRPIRPGARRILFRGSARACALCGRTSALFLPAGEPRPRPDALCPWCGSLERHRLAWLYIERQLCLPSSAGTLLHFAPERSLTAGLKRSPALRVVTADIGAGEVDVRADAISLPFRNASFDWIYCSHVLEHVPDDRRAMSELRRVLRPGGVALVQVPVRPGRTFEDPSVTKPEERLRIFGQEDHVRWYGSDVAERLCDAGLAVRAISASELLSDREIERFGILADEPLYHCERNE